MKKYFAYVRVSTVKQGEHGSSLQEQRSAIEAFAGRQQLSIVEWFEETETAAKLGRRVFSRMLKQLERGDADGLIIHKIDRSARNLRDWANLGDLIDSGVDVQFAHDSVDLRSRGGRLSADIQAVVAADYIRNLREEVRKGFYGRLKQGLYPLPAPIGYLNMGRGRKKEIDPVRAPLVRQAFELYATATVGLHKLRAEMGRRGLSASDGKMLSLTYISKMLNNPFYYGLIYIGTTGETFQGIHQPIITKALFDRVQAILRGKTVMRSVKHDFAFRRFVRCEGCGHHLIGERQKGRVYYRCQGQTCKGTCIREDVLESVVLKNLSLLAFDDAEGRELREIVESMRVDATGELENLKRTLDMRVAKCGERLGRMTDAFVDGLIDKDVFEARKASLLNERRGLEDQLSSLSPNHLASNQAFEKLELGNAAYSGYQMGIPVERRAILKAVTSNFSLQGKKLDFALQSPFQEIANWRKSLDGAPYRTTPRTRAKQIIAIFVGDAAVDKKQALLKRTA